MNSLKLENKYFLQDKQSGKFLNKSDQFAAKTPYEDDVYSAASEDAAKAKRSALGAASSATVQDIPRYVRD